MVKVHKRIVWLPVLVIFALGLVFLQLGYGPGRGSTVVGPAYSVEGQAYAAQASPQQRTEAAGDLPLQGGAQAEAASLQAQASPTAGPFEAEVLPPVVSAPVQRGTGLFDEIADRLLRSLLNIF